MIYELSQQLKSKTRPKTFESFKVFFKLTHHSSLMYYTDYIAYSKDIYRW